MTLSSERTRSLALLGVLTALAFVLGWLESMLPSFTGIPGVKAGFANIVTMMLLFMPAKNQRPVKETLLPALAVSVIRVLLAGITYNGLSAGLYGLAGAVASLFLMYFLKRTGIFSVTAVSVAGGVAHNAAQLALACILLGSAVFYYLPYLIVSGLVSGAAIGLLSALLVRKLRSTPLTDI